MAKQREIKAKITVAVKMTQLARLGRQGLNTPLLIKDCDVIKLLPKVHLLKLCPLIFYEIGQCTNSPIIQLSKLLYDATKIVEKIVLSMLAQNFPGLC